MASIARSLRMLPVSTGLSGVALAGLAGVALAGCDPVAVTDAGTDAPIVRDTPPPIPYTCEGEPTVIDGVLNETATVMFDTTMTPERPRDLGLRCGNASAEVRWARQEVVEYRVPGTGPVAVEFSAINTATSTNFNTLIQVRRDCSTVPDQFFPPTCIDDATMSEVRSRGAFQAMGGDTLYFIVTGYSDPEPVSGDVDEGPIQVDFTPRTNTPPTIESANVIINGTAMVLNARASDAEGPIFGFALQLFTAAGQIDLEGDGDTDSQDVLPFGWEMVTGTNPYDATSTITPDADGYRLAEYCRAVGCTEAGIAVFDAQYSASAFLRVPINEATLVGVGEVCDNLTTVCTSGTTCIGGTCAITGPVATACGAAALIPIDGPFDATPVSVSVTGALGRGAGSFNSPCAGAADVVASSIGREAIYRIDITTPGMYTLDLNTAQPGTGAGDTILYLRGADCWDSRPASSLGCNDDIAMGMLGSAVTATVTEGTYYVFVEFFNGVATASAPYELRTTLTRIGAALDGGMPMIDAGEPDAGEADAGEADAGEADAGMPDAPK